MRSWLKGLACCAGTECWLQHPLPHVDFISLTGPLGGPDWFTGDSVRAVLAQGDHLSMSATSCYYRIHLGRPPWVQDKAVRLPVKCVI